MPNTFTFEEATEPQTFNFEEATTPAEQPSQTPPIELSKIQNDPYTKFKLEESKASNLPDYPITVPPSLNPNYDLARYMVTDSEGNVDPLSVIKPFSETAGGIVKAGETGIRKVLDIPAEIKNKITGAKSDDFGRIGFNAYTPTFSDREEWSPDGTIVHFPRSSGTSAVAGAVNTVSDFATQMLGNPERVVGLALVPGEGAAGRAAAGLYGTQAAAAVPDAVKNAYRMTTNPDPNATVAEEVESLAQPVIQAEFARQMLGHATAPEPTPQIQGPYSLGRFLKTPAGAEPPLKVEGFEPLDVQSGAPLSPQELIARQSRTPTPPETPEPEIKTFDLDKESEQANAPQIRQQPESNQPEYPGDAGERTPTQPGGGGSTAQGAPAPEAKADESGARTGNARGTPDEEVSPLRQGLADVAGMNSDEFAKHVRGKQGGLTGEAWRIGQSVTTPEELADLKTRQEKEAQEFQQAKLVKNFNAMNAAAMKGQFFREAYEAATGTGSAGKSLRESNPDYKPPFPEGKTPELVGMGAATPSEFEPENQFTTSNKNAVVDKERAARGLPPLMKVARESLGDVWDHAMSLIDNDSQIGTRLVNEITQTGKLADWLDADTQNAILLHERISLRNALDKSLANLKRAVDDGYEPGIEENRLLSARLSDDLQKLDSATRTAGTQLGRGLNARRMMANEDYSLAAMETRKRAANGGKPLTDAQRAEIQSLHDKIKSNQEAYDKHVAELQQRISELEAKKETAAVVEDVKKEAKSKPKGTGTRDLVTEQINIKQGIEEKLADGTPITEIGNWIQKLARNFVEMGVRDADKLVDSVHGILKEIIPGMDRRQVMDAISGYGDFKQLSKDETSVELRRMKGELQQLGKIEDLNAKKPPLKTGVERRTPSLLERQRIKIVNELKRKLGIQVTDPAKQLQSALGSIKTRLQHEIDDLDFQIRTKERLVKTKTPTPLDAEAVALKERRDALKKQFDEVFGPRQMTDEQRIQLASKQLDSRIAEVERQLKSGEIFPKSKEPSKTPSTPALAAKRAQLDALKEQRDWARDLIQPKDVPDAGIAEEKRLKSQIEELERQIRNREVFPKGKSSLEKPTNATIESQRKVLEELKARRDAIREEIQPKPERDPEAIAIRAAKTRMKTRIAELQSKLANGDFSKRTRTPVKLDEEGLKLRAAYEKTKDDFERGLMKDRLKNRSRFEKALDGISKWRRTFVLSYPSILAKLTAASGELIGITPAEEAVGGALSKLPLLSKVAEKAPRQGGFNLQAEVDAVNGTWKNLFEAAKQKFKTGQSDIDVLYGEPRLLPPELKDFVSNIHGALKEPARQNEFYRSFRKRLDFAAKNGADITDPLVQSKIGFEAYKDANRQIFTESNMLADAFNRALTRFSQADKAIGKASPFGKAAEAAVRYELPIIRIPLNIVKRAFEYSFGTAIGSARLARALSNGLDNLTPDQADVILRNFKRGSLGLAMVALGFFNPQSVGGYYQQGQKRNPKDVKIGGLRVFGQDIPPALVHNPLLEQLQIGATIRRVADSKLRKHDQNPQGYANGVMAAYGGLIEETPFVRQAEDSLKALNPHERKQFLGQLLQSTVPGVAQWAAQQMDRDAQGNLIQRKPNTVGQYFEQAVPVLRENVPVKRP